jgi:hypothetical protein
MRGVGARLGRATASAGRINRLAALRAARRYLEIGVADGGTFLHVDIPFKHAVDPRFRFPTAEHETETVRFFEMTSDAYFTRAAPPGLTFDIIFIDGLHTFEQAFRDFCATQRLAHDRTIWLIDDVYPSDVFSSLPSQQDAVRFRKRHGADSGVWHGDVYKCVFAIRDFFPNLDFRTFAKGEGNPQTVVLARRRSDFSPVLGDVERIARMDYFGFWENRDKLNLASSEALFDWVAADDAPGAPP